jgi:hypothetical protein
MDFAETKRRLRCFHPVNLELVHRHLLLKRLSPCPAYVVFCLVGDEVFRPDRPRLGPTRIKESSSTTSFLSMALLASAMVASLLFTMLATSTILALVAAAAALAACLFRFLFSLAAFFGSGRSPFPGQATASRWSSQILTTSGLSAVSTVLVDNFASSSYKPVEAGKVVFSILTTSA